MSISTQAELEGMKKVSEAVAVTLRKMREYARPGMSTLDLDLYGGELLKNYGARSAPRMTYGFPGWTCISVNEEIAHGIPSAGRILREGDLVNIDVSAELDGFWSDNGGSFVLGQDLHGHMKLVETSKMILREAIAQIRGGQRISETGRLIESKARKAGYCVIRNLTGHGIGRSLHEPPFEITNYPDRHNRERFRRHSVVAIETFISTASTLAMDTSDGWTFVGNKGGFVAQHEHTIVITDTKPLVLTESNGIG